jgi:hypothetical protein
VWTMAGVVRCRAELYYTNADCVLLKTVVVPDSVGV